MYTVHPEQVTLAIELAAGAEENSRSGLAKMLPHICIEATAKTFVADEASLRAGMGPAFESSRYDGTGGNHHAHERLHYVCGMLSVLNQTHLVPSDLSFLTKRNHSGETCYHLLVSAIGHGKAERVSLYALWNMVNLLWVQFKEMSRPNSAVEQCLGGTTVWEGTSAAGVAEPAIIEKEPCRTQGRPPHDKGKVNLCTKALSF